MAGVIARGSISRLLQEGVADVFGNSLKEHPKLYPGCFEEKGSKKAYEVAVQMEGFGLAVEKDEGDDISFDSRRQGFTPKFIHTVQAKGFIVTEEALDDELYGQLDEGAQALARAMRITKEFQGFNVFNNGFDTTVTMVDGDGDELFNTAHSNGPSGGTYSNRLATDVDLTEATLEDALAIVQNMDDARGLPAHLKCKKLLVAAGTSSFNAQRIVNSVLQNDTGNNATNAVRDMNSVQDGWMSSPYLTDDDAWFLITDAPHGLCCYNRRGIRFGRDNAFTSGNARFKSDERYSFGWKDARGAIGSQGG